MDVVSKSIATYINKTNIATAIVNTTKFRVGLHFIFAKERTKQKQEGKLHRIDFLTRVLSFLKKVHKTLLFGSLSTKKKLVGKTFEKIEAVFASIQQASKQKVAQKKTNWEIRTLDEFFTQKIAFCNIA